MKAIVTFSRVYEIDLNDNYDKDLDLKEYAEAHAREEFDFEWEFISPVEDNFFAKVEIIKN